MKLSQALFPLAVFASTIQAGFSSNSKTNVVVYWGQNSYGQGSGSLSQQRLSVYCDNSNIDVIVLSFLTRFKGLGDVPELNFANQGEKDKCTVFPGTNLLNCPEMAADIQTCQTKGKTILLSLGGATYTEGGFPTVSEAEAYATKIWSIFGPPSTSSTSSPPRPFGTSVVDGFDFDYEAVVSNMTPFANKLRTLMTSSTARTDKSYFLTAAPQCPFPDLAMNPMLDGQVAFDAVMIQFYNNFCGLQSFLPATTPSASAPQQPVFNFAQWDTWAKNTSKNKNVKVLLGVPANKAAAGTGYLPLEQLKGVIEYSQGFASFGGVMMWDVTQAVANEGFLAGVRSSVKGVKDAVIGLKFKKGKGKDGKAKDGKVALKFVG